MNKKTIGKIILDVIMTVLLLLLMTRQITGEEGHEWVGSALFVLLIGHHILNFKWYKSLNKGKYSTYRTIQTVINIIIFILLIICMVSGIILSRYVFADLPILGGSSLARVLHMLSSYWSFILTAVHLGLHWNMIIGMSKKMHGFHSTKITSYLAKFLALIISLYGFYAFMNNGVIDYLFMNVAYSFLDYEKAKWLLFTEYLSIMGLFVSITYYVSKGLRYRK